MLVCETVREVLSDPVLTDEVLPAAISSRLTPAVELADEVVFGSVLVRELDREAVPGSVLVRELERVVTVLLLA